MDIKKVGKMWLPMHAPYPEHDLRQEQVTFRAQPDYYFKPIGLMLWNLPADAVLVYTRMCNEEAVLAGVGPLPAQIFSRAKSYEALKELVENGEEILNDWIDAPSASPANVLSIHLASKIPHGFINTQAAMWGIAERR